MNLDPNTFIKPLASSWVGDALTTAVGYGLNQSIDAYEPERRDDMERIRQQAEKSLGDYVPAATVHENRKSMAISGSAISTATVASDMAKSQETLVRAVVESMVKEAVASAISEISVANTDKYKAAVEMMAILFDQGHDEAAKLLCKSMTVAKQ